MLSLEMKIWLEEEGGVLSWSDGYMEKHIIFT